MITVKPVAGATEWPEEQIPLQAQINGKDATEHAEWAIAFNGPGHMDANSPGLYHVDPSAEARFVCIIAMYDGGFMGIYKGHAILPLPFEAFPDELQAMSHG